jgi:hypothetical protein
MQWPRTIAPIIVAVFLLLPLLYVASYVVLVRPNVRVIKSPAIVASNVEHYRLPGRICGRFFWPLEKVDRRLRPGAWDTSVLIELERINMELRESEHSQHGPLERYVPLQAESD